MGITALSKSELESAPSTGHYAIYSGRYREVQVYVVEKGEVGLWVFFDFPYADSHVVPVWVC
jgi:hypothetical protein